MDEQLYRKVSDWVVTRHTRTDTSSGGDGGWGSSGNYTREDKEQLERFDTQEEAQAFVTELVGSRPPTLSKWFRTSDPWTDERYTISKAVRYVEVD